MRVLVFFTYGVSLQQWNDKGLLQREIRLYRELIDRFGVSVTFVTYGDKSDYAYQDLVGNINIVPVYHFMKKPNNKYLQILQTILIPVKIREAIKESDIIKTNQIFGAWVAGVAKVLYKKPLLVRCGYEFYDFSIKANKSLFYKWFAYSISWFAYKCANRVHVATAQDRQFVLNRFKVKSEAVRVLQNWIDLEVYKKFFEPLGKRDVLFVGRLNKQKNIFLLIKALSGTGISLDIVGEGSLKGKIQKKAVELGVVLNFLGSIPNDEMPKLYNSYKVYVLCSYYEGNPKTLLEAMACGCAVIGTNVPGIREVVINRKNGLLVEEDDCELRDSIVELINNPLLCKNLGESAVETISHNNSLEKICIKEAASYESICVRQLFRFNK